MAKRRMMLFKFFLLAVVASVVITRILGVQRGLLHKTRVPPHGSFSRVQEAAIDDDGDGRPEVLEVLVGESHPYQCSFVLQDSNRDGRLDKFGCLIGNAVACALFDEDEDGQYDRRVVGMVDISDHYQYRDLDLDGKFDIMLRADRGRALSAHLFMNETLVGALMGRAHGRRDAWIEGPNGSPVRLVLENGEWHVKGITHEPRHER